MVEVCQYVYCVLLQFLVKEKKKENRKKEERGKLGLAMFRSGSQSDDRQYDSV